MTTKEKAAAYDAAIKKVKELAIDDYLDAIAVTDIFPELKEIEDEKIINRIKKAVKVYWSDEPLDEILAWLEKQGETSPILSNSSNIEKDKQKPADRIEPKFKVRYAGSEYNVSEIKDIAGVTFYGIEDEPNHIDYVKADNCETIWSEEDEHRLKDTIYFLDTNNWGEPYIYMYSNNNI
mgnify:CR=1 FL=1